MRLIEKELGDRRIKADAWFSLGNRLIYDHRIKTIVNNNNNTGDKDTSIRIWNRIVDGTYASDGWLTMMPGFPDGSYGWSSTEQYIKDADKIPRLYVEYVGMGDSDKPEGYKYGVKERADMVEALWKHHNIKLTSLVTFDFSSLVALELLSRQITRIEMGADSSTIIDKVFFINGGLFADAHSHPLLTTPLLKTTFGRMGAKMAQNSKRTFNMMIRDLWSKEYGVTKEELAENHKAVGRRGGAVFMSNAAGFVDEHKKNANRWDFKRIFDATYPNIRYIVAGSEKDKFEYKQVEKAKEELMYRGLEVVMFPGGHMTTSEYPDLIAKTILRMRSIR